MQLLFEFYSRTIVVALSLILIGIYEVLHRNFGEGRLSLSYSIFKNLDSVLNFKRLLISF